MLIKIIIDEEADRFRKLNLPKERERGEAAGFERAKLCRLR